MKKNNFFIAMENWVKVLGRILKKERTCWAAPQSAATGLVLVDVRRKIKNQYGRNHYATMHYHFLR